MRPLHFFYQEGRSCYCSAGAESQATLDKIDKLTQGLEEFRCELRQHMCETEQSVQLLGDLSLINLLTMFQKRHSHSDSDSGSGSDSECDNDSD